MQLLRAWATATAPQLVPASEWNARLRPGASTEVLLLGRSRTAPAGPKVTCAAT